MSVTEKMQAGADLGQSVIKVGEGLFGTSTSGSGTVAGTTTVDKTRTQGLQIDEVGIMKMIGDILKGTKGLAGIFGEEQVAGLYKGSVAKQDAASLLGQIAGELAKVTGKTVATDVGTTVVDTKTTQESGKGGLIKQVGDFFGF